MKFATPSGYVLIIALFFFSFTEFNCSGTKLLELRGIELVTGKEGSQKKEVQKTDSRVDEILSEELDVEQNDIEPVIWADLSFGFAILGLTVFLIVAAAGKLGGAKIVHVIIGGLGAISQFAIKIHIDNELETQETFRILNVTYQPAYWLVLTLFVLILVLNILPGFKVVKTNEQKEGEPNFQVLGNIE